MLPVIYASPFLQIVQLCIQQGGPFESPKEENAHSPCQHQQGDVHQTQCTPLVGTIPPAGVGKTYPMR